MAIFRGQSILGLLFILGSRFAGHFVVWFAIAEVDLVYLNHQDDKMNKDTLHSRPLEPASLKPEVAPLLALAGWLAGWQVHFIGCYCCGWCSKLGHARSIMTISSRDTQVASSSFINQLGQIVSTPPLYLKL